MLTAFLLYLRQFYDPMEDVAIFYNSLQSATAALEKISAVLAEPPAVPEPVSPVPLAAAGPRCASTLDAVEFSYRPDRPVLHELSTWTSRPGRRSRSSARRAPARRRSRS